MLPDLLKAPLSRLVIFLCVLTLLACPGALIIWIMNPEQFKILNSFHMIVLSIALIMPFIMMNAVTVCLAFPLHRWIARRRRNKLTPRPREAVVAAAAIFAGAIGAIVPAYAPILARVFGWATTIREMSALALTCEAVPLVALLLINPTNYWQGIDDARGDAGREVKPMDIAVQVHVHRDRLASGGRLHSDDRSNDKE